MELQKLTLGASIAEDVGTKLLMCRGKRKYPSRRSYSIYLPIQGLRKIRCPGGSWNKSGYYFVSDNTRFKLKYYNLLNSTVLPIAFVFRWIKSTTLLRGAYQRIGKLPLSFWIILSLPLILYLVGKMPGFFYGESMAGVDEAYRYYFRILFRAVPGGNIVFGLAFFVIARRIASSRIKDYLIITGIGDTIVGIALSTSALEPTYGASCAFAHCCRHICSALDCMFALYLWLKTAR